MYFRLQKLTFREASIIAVDEDSETALAKHPPSKSQRIG
jgi:hypothetical protein